MELGNPYKDGDRVVILDEYGNEERIGTIIEVYCDDFGAVLFDDGKEENVILEYPLVPYPEKVKNDDERVD